MPAPRLFDLGENEILLTDSFVEEMNAWVGRRAHLTEAAGSRIHRSSGTIGSVSYYTAVNRLDRVVNVDFHFADAGKLAIAARASNMLHIQSGDGPLLPVRFPRQ